jgi:CheY-like chemotaxis protein/GAF domain-containing protein
MATILLVDDVELFLQLEESFLEDCGHQLVTATSGEEALERMQSINPDLLLLDLYLPGIDGDEVCRRLRSTEAWANLPIVMVTAAGKETEIHKCLAAGCDDYLTKPINKKDLLDKVQRLLGWAVPRSAPRVSAPLRVQLTNSGRSLSTNARDISRTGIYVRSPHPLQVESLVELLVEFSATEQVSLAGMVKRVEQGAEPGMGIYFVHPDPKGQAALDRYVRSQAGEPQASAQQAVTQDERISQLQNSNQDLLEENYSLNNRILELEAENREFAEQIVNIEEVNNNLTNLYIASTRLHSVLDLGKVVEIIREVVINFVGAEQFALLIWDKEKQKLCFQAGEGFEPEVFPEVAPGEGLLGEVFVAGVSYLHDGNVSQGSQDPLQPLAAIPLMIHGEVSGVLAIYHLFIQKEKFEPVDRQLFSMMAEHAATALFSANLYGESERKRQTYRGMMDLLLK